MNKDIKTLIALFFLTALVIVFGYFSKIIFVPLTGNAHLMMGLVSAWVALRLSFIKNKNSLMKDWHLFFLFLSLFMLFMTLPHLLLATSAKYSAMFPQAMNWGYIIGHIFMYMAIAFFVRLPLQWTFPKLKNTGTIIFLIMGAIGTIWNILHPNHPVFDPITGITNLNIDPIAGKIVVLNVALVFVPAGIYFLVKGLKSSERIVKTRALILAAGFIVSTVGGPLHDVARQQILFMVADILALAGLSIIAMGVFYKIDLAPKIASPPAS